MELIEDHTAHTTELWVAMEHACQYALGDDLNARLARHAGIEPHAVAHCFTDGFAQVPSHAACDRASRDAPRFEQ